MVHLFQQLCIHLFLQLVRHRSLQLFTHQFLLLLQNRTRFTMSLLMTKAMLQRYLISITSRCMMQHDSNTFSNILVLKVNCCRISNTCSNLTLSVMTVFLLLIYPTIFSGIISNNITILMPLHRAPIPTVVSTSSYLAVT